MKKVLKNYLEHLQKKNESMFPIDSPGKSNGKPLIIKPVYEELDKAIKKILIDLDGTIHKYSKGFIDGSMYDVPNEGAVEFINELKNKGFSIIIYTARIQTEDDSNNREQTLKIKNWLKKYKIPYDDIISKKIPAIAYVDDRAVEFKNNDWNHCLERIEELTQIEI